LILLGQAFDAEGIDDDVLRAGSQSASSPIDAISMTWVSSSQPRRRPSRRVSTGTSSASTAGDQKTFAQYGAPTAANRPMVLMSTPLSVIQACSVWPASENGSPAEKPSSSTISTRGLK
jgi:hypothetical protein